VITSPDDAFLLLDNWASDGTPLTVMLVAEGVGMWTQGRVVEVTRTPASFELRGPTGYCLVDLRSATFEYEDPREAPAQVREFSTARFVDSLAVRLPSANRCVLFHMREPTAT
jgi:hypothetical protein